MRVYQFRHLGNPVSEGGVIGPLTPHVNGEIQHLSIAWKAIQSRELEALIKAVARAHISGGSVEGQGIAAAYCKVHRLEDIAATAEIEAHLPFTGHHPSHSGRAPAR